MNDGIYPAMTRAQYDAVDVDHWSLLKVLIDRSPRHFVHAVETEGEKDTDAFRLGRAFHTALLEPAIFETSYAVWPKARGTRATNAYKDFAAAAVLEHKEVLMDDEVASAIGMALSARNHAPASRYLDGQREASVLWTYKREQLGGVPGYLRRLKSRVDLIGDGFLLEVKSTKAGSPRGFGLEAARYLYHAQAALYSAALEAVLRRRFRAVILAVENFAPFVPSVYVVSDADLALGLSLCVDALDQLERCERDKHWPGYFTGEQPLELPIWAKPNDNALESFEVVS